MTGYEYSRADQPEVLVLITEKTGDLLWPACRELGAGPRPGAGYTSCTRAIQLLRHAGVRNQPLHAFCVSGWDDAGENMPVAAVSG